MHEFFFKGMHLGHFRMKIKENNAMSSLAKIEYFDHATVFFILSPSKEVVGMDLDPRKFYTLEEALKFLTESPEKLTREVTKNDEMNDVENDKQNDVEMNDVENDMDDSDVQFEVGQLRVMDDMCTDALKLIEGVNDIMDPTENLNLKNPIEAGFVPFKKLSITDDLDDKKTSSKNCENGERENEDDPVYSEKKIDDNDDEEGPSNSENNSGNEEDPSYIPNSSSEDETSGEDVENSGTMNDLTRGRKRTRKMKRSVGEWNRNKRKLANQRGDRHVNSRKKIKDERSPKPLTETRKKCRFKCEEHFDEESRSTICRAYWALGDYARQGDFLLNCINEREVHRRSRGAEKHNSVSREYHLGLGNEKHRVCHYFFHATLSISKSTSNHTLAKRSSNNTVRPDMRGKAVPPHNKTPREKIDRVKKHIDKFPRVESHYCRASTTREYLDASLNINKMYNLYLEWISDQTDADYVEGYEGVKASNVPQNILYRI